MKLQIKIALVIGLIGLLSSCQKEDLDSMSNSSTQENGSSMRIGNPDSNNNGGWLNDGNNPVNADSSGIVGGGDDDRDGGGIVGGGDDDSDGGNKKAGGNKH